MGRSILSIAGRLSGIQNIQYWRYYTTLLSLYTETLKRAFVVKYSEKGSIYRPVEEQTYVNYVDFLDECEGNIILLMYDDHFSYFGM